MADGKPLSFQGQGSFRINIGSDNDTGLQHEVWVADIELEGILGYDFLYKYNCNLDVGRGEMTIQEKAVKCERTRAMCCRVVADETVVIPARGEFLLPVRIVGKHDKGLAILEPTTTFTERHEDMMVAKALIDTRKEHVPVRVLNLSDQPARLYKGTNIAECEPVDVVPQENRNRLHMAVVHTQDGSTTADRKLVDVHVPQHLEDLYDRCSTNLDEKQRQGLLALLTRHQDVFASSSEDMGKTSVYRHRIDTGGAKPIRQPARRLPIHQREEADAEVEKMLKRGVIEPSSSPWASPIVLVKKKDGTTRFCVDYRKLNAATIKDSYPLPRIDDSLDALSGSVWFSTLDLQSGYWQVEMAEEDREKTAFVTGTGIGFYQFKVMPFGLCNAPATFERLMERVLAGLQWQTCLLYIDDIISYGQNFQQALEIHVEKLSTKFAHFQPAW